MRSLKLFNDYKQDLLQLSASNSNQNFKDNLELLQSWSKVNQAIQTFQREASSYLFEKIFGEQSSHYSHMYFETYDRNFEAFCTCFTTSDRDALMFYILENFSQS